MFDLVKAYADLVTLRGALVVSHSVISKTTSHELEAVLRFTEARVCEALHAMAEEDREEAIESLDDLYEGEARDDLEALL